MSQIQSTFTATGEALASGRVGTPLAARIVLQAGAEATSCEAAIGVALAHVTKWFGQPPTGYYSFEQQQPRQGVVLARFAGGQSALVSVIGLGPGPALLGMSVWGPRGTIAFDAGGADEVDSEPLAHTPDSQRPFEDAWRNRIAVPAPAQQPAAARNEQARPPLKPPFGVLLVGGSYTHQENYAEQFAADRRVRLVGLSDAADVAPRRRELNERLAKILQVPYFDDLDAALRRPEVQVVSMCAEPDRRAPLIVRCAEAGKHVYLDKPLCSRMEDAREIVRAVHSAHVATQMFSMVHGAPAERLRTLVRGGQLGTLAGLHTELTFAKGPAGTAALDRPRKETSPPTSVELADTKRELTNVGIYPTVLALWLSGDRVTHVAATTGNYFFREHQTNDHEDFGQMVLVTSGGRLVTISAGRTGWQTHTSRGLDSTCLVGTRGLSVVDAHRPRLNVFADEPAWQTPARNNDDPMGFWSSTTSGTAKRGWLAAPPVTGDIEFFLDTLESGRASDVPVELAYEATEVLLSAYRSAAEQNVVSVSDARK